MMGDVVISFVAGVVGAIAGYSVAWAIHRWRHRPGLPFHPRLK